MRELSLNVMDIAQNCLSAQANLIKIIVTEMSDPKKLIIEIIDDGCGMTEKQVKNVVDPFYTTRTTRKVGMGVPLFKMAAELTGGSFSISSKLNVGTNVRAEFLSNSVNMTPLGDINSTVSLLIKCNPDKDFLFTHKVDEKSFTLDTRELKEVLGDVGLDSPDVTEWINDYLREGYSSKSD